MWGVAWLSWMAGAALVLGAHHVAWWLYPATFASLVLSTYIGWAAFDAPSAMAVASLCGMIAAAALLYLTHVEWWVYAVVGSACWIGASAGRVAARHRPPEAGLRHAGDTD